MSRETTFSLCPASPIADIENQVQRKNSALQFRVATPRDPFKIPTGRTPKIVLAETRGFRSNPSDQQMKPILFVSIITACVELSAATASWPQFRGPNSSGVATKDKPPTQFGAGTNLLWKVEAPPGLSSPCVAGD